MVKWDLYRLIGLIPFALTGLIWYLWIMIFLISKFTWTPQGVLYVFGMIAWFIINILLSIFFIITGSAILLEE